MPGGWGVPFRHAGPPRRNRKGTKVNIVLKVADGLRSISPETRAKLYALVVALIPVLIVVGVVASDDATLWLNLAGAVLGISAAGVATANRPTLAGQDADEVPVPAEEAVQAAPVVEAAFGRHAAADEPAE